MSGSRRGRGPRGPILSVTSIVGRFLLCLYLSDPWFPALCWKTCFLGLWHLFIIHSFTQSLVHCSLSPALSYEVTKSEDSLGEGASCTKALCWMSPYDTVSAQSGEGRRRTYAESGERCPSVSVGRAVTWLHFQQAECRVQGRFARGAGVSQRQPVFVHKVLLARSPSTHLPSLATFARQWQGWVSVADRTRTARPSALLSAPCRRHLQPLAEHMGSSLWRWAERCGGKRLCGQA